jgi:hydroxymethylbilane synthase
MREHLKFLDSPASRAATSCERALLNKLGGGCQVPIGAFAEMKEGELTLVAVCAKPDGSRVLRQVQTGTDPLELGERTGLLLLNNGGEEILKEVHSSAAAAPQQP